jgi:ketopantoate reductase
MDKLARYRQHIRELLQEYSTYRPSYGEVEVEHVIDTIHDHYQLLTVGWHQDQRVHGCVFHIDIKENKIWVQHDGTEDGIANRLVAYGVPKSDIVLAFHAPYRRRFTEFAAG